MKNTFKLAAVLAFLGAGTASAFAVDYTTGTVDKVKKGKVTITHGEIKNLDMPAMTMVFVPADDGIAAKLTEGKKVEFVVERVKGKLTITEVK